MVNYIYLQSVLAHIHLCTYLLWHIMFLRQRRLACLEMREIRIRSTTVVLKMHHHDLIRRCLLLNVKRCDSIAGFRGRCNHGFSTSATHEITERFCERRMNRWCGGREEWECEWRRESVACFRYSSEIQNYLLIIFSSFVLSLFPSGWLQVRRKQVSKHAIRREN